MLLSDGFRCSRLVHANLNDVADPIQDNQQPPAYPWKHLPPYYKRVSYVHDGSGSEQPFDRETSAIETPQAIGTAFTIGYEQLLPVILSTNSAGDPPKLALEFVGGFGLCPLLSPFMCKRWREFRKG